MEATSDALDGDEAKIAKVEGGVNDYVAVKLNGGDNGKVNPICSCSEIVSKPVAYVYVSGIGPKYSSP